MLGPDHNRKISTSLLTELNLDAYPFKEEPVYDVRPLEPHPLRTSSGAEMPLDAAVVPSADGQVDMAHIIRE